MEKLSKQPRSKVLISGASGFIGSYLTEFLHNHEFEVYTLVRQNPTNNHEISWNPSEQSIDSTKLQKIKPDIVINLSGASIARGLRWTQKRKDIVYNSRIHSTTLLTQTIEILPSVHTFVSTSAVGYYGSSKQNVFNEESSRGQDFLARVCADWEEASQVVRSDVRVVNPRFGIVMDTSGGFLKQILMPIKLFGGVVLGTGDNFISWISRRDLARAIHEIIINKNLRGPVNVVTPRAISQKDLMREIARAYNRPMFFRIPVFLLRLVFGREKSDTFFIANQKVVPQKLLDAGFEWENGDIKNILN